MIQKNRLIGVHVRIKTSMVDVVNAVQQFELPLVQSFLINESGRYLSFFSSTFKKFIKSKNELGFNYFVHAAYWSNLTDVSSREFLSLCKEANMACDLQSQGIVVHVGATRKGLSKIDQAKYVSEAINELFHRVADIPILLENGPHAGRNFGGNVTDFALLSDLIEDKNRVKFCIDTAHAFVYGYNFIYEQDRKQFLKELETIFEKSSIGLLHLNDTDESCGSQIDKHGIVGQAKLGQTVLVDFMHAQPLEDVGIILELPSSCDDEQIALTLKQVRSWDNKNLEV